MGNSLSNALNPTSDKGVLTVPDGYTTPPWPSLYLPTLDSTVQNEGIFLYEAEAIWRFTLYWSLLLLCSLFLICALLASFSLMLSMTVFRSSPPPPLYEPGGKPQGSRSASDTPPYSGRSPRTATSATPFTTSLSGQPVERQKSKRPPLWPVVILPVAAVVVAAVIALVTGTVVGFTLAAVYSAGGFSMSTWVPFLWALIIALVLIISSYSTLTTVL